MGIKSKRHVRAGFTLLEVTMATALVGALAATMFSYFTHSDKIFEKNKARMELERKALNIGEDIRNDLTRYTTTAGGGWALVNNTSFTGSQVIGYNTTANTNLYGSTIMWRIEYSTGDPNNNVDDDGDGLTDEMTLVRIVDGVSSIKADNVKEGSFKLSSVGQVVTFQATFEKYVGKTQTIVSFATTPRKFTLN